eukprot:scaffold250849_cov27-Tisochrysis_lutea.AAC.3
MAFLLAKGADLYARDNDGFDALVAAATGGSAAACSFLLQKVTSPLGAARTRLSPRVSPSRSRC